MRRRTDSAQAIARVAARAESYDNAAPRRPIHGHTADCPERHKGPLRRCRFCRAEALASTRVNGVAVPNTSALAGGRRHLAAVPDTHPDRPTHPPAAPREPELRSCRVCYAPTTDRDNHCQPTEATGA